MQKIFLILGTILAGLGVALGAFGAHGLKKIVPPETVSSYQTGVQYQMYHAFALLLVGILSERLSRTLINWSGAFFCFRHCAFFRFSLFISLIKSNE